MGCVLLMCVSSTVFYRQSGYLYPCTERIKPRNSVSSFQIYIAPRTTVTIMMSWNLRRKVLQIHILPKAGTMHHRGEC